MGHAAEPPDGNRDPILVDVYEASHRLLVGLPRKTMRDLQSIVFASRETYPWREVVERILAEPLGDEAALMQSGLKAQRDWVKRGGRLDASADSKRSCLGAILSMSFVFLVFLATVVVLLVVARMHWPEADIYRLIDWLHETFPGRFKPR